MIRRFCFIIAYKLIVKAFFKFLYFHNFCFIVFKFGLVCIVVELNSFYSCCYMEISVVIFLRRSRDFLNVAGKFIENNELIKTFIDNFKLCIPN